MFQTKVFSKKCLAECTISVVFHGFHPSAQGFEVRSILEVAEAEGLWNCGRREHRLGHGPLNSEFGIRLIVICMMPFTSPNEIDISVSRRFNTLDIEKSSYEVTGSRINLHCA